MQQCYWNLAAMLHPRNIPDDTHFDVAMATCSVPVSCVFKMKYCHLRLKAKYLVLSKTYASPTFIKGSLSTSVLCGRWVVWQPFSLISKLQLSEPWLFLRIFCACERFTVRCLKTSLHRRISIFICVFFFCWIKFVPKKPRFCCRRVECRDVLRNVVGRQGMKKNKTILLRESTFNLWNQRKIDLGFQGNANSEFAEFLLHSLAQWQFEQESVRMVDGAEGKKNTTAADSKRFVLRWN